MLALVDAVGRLTQGESMSVGRDGASDAVSFLQEGIPAVEFGPSGAGHHGPDEWVSISSLAHYRQALSRLRAPPARVAGARGRRPRAARRRGRPRVRLRRTAAGGRRTEEKPPRLGRGLLLRGLLAGVIVILATASAVSATVMLQVDDIINIIEREGRAPIEIPEIDRADAGSAQTIMILGSDRRYGDREAGLKPRSDTILLVRLDPDKSVIAVTSVPRDLLVEIPGLGPLEDQRGLRGGRRAPDRADGQAAAVHAGAQVPGQPRRHRRLQRLHRVIDYIGCVYVDIDRDYFNDQGGPLGYATIDIDPGYQKLCGRDSLDYVRYRHGDNDLVRAARQQDFLRQIRNQQGIRKLSSPAPGNLQEARADLRPLLRLGQGPAAEEADLRPRQDGAVHVAEPGPRGAVPGLGRGRRHQPRRLRRRSSRRPWTSSSRRAAPTARARESEPTDAERASRAARAKKKKPAAIKGLEEARAEGENQAIVGARRIDFPFFFPTVRTSGSGYVGQAPRTYTVRDELRRKHDAYRLVVAREHRGRVLRRPGHHLARPADPRRPVRDDRPQRPQAARLPRRPPHPARGLAHPQGASTGSPTRSPSRSRGRR